MKVAFFDFSAQVQRTFTLAGDAYLPGAWAWVVLMQMESALHQFHAQVQRTFTLAGDAYLPGAWPWMVLMQMESALHLFRMLNCSEPWARGLSLLFGVVAIFLVGKWLVRNPGGTGLR